MSCNPRPIMRKLRVHIASTVVRTELSAAPAPENNSPCTWSLKVWAVLLQQPPVGASAPYAESDPVPFDRYFSAAYVTVPSLTPPVEAEWRAGGGGSSSTCGIEVARTTAVGADTMAKVALRLRQPAGNPSAGPVPPASRVRIARNLTSVLGLVDSHYSYAEVEEALWLLIKERGLLEPPRRDEPAAIRISGHRELAAALDIDVRARPRISLQEVRASSPLASRLARAMPAGRLLPAPTEWCATGLPCTQLPKYLHNHLKLWEPPNLQHQLVVTVSPSLPARSKRARPAACARPAARDTPHARRRGAACASLHRAIDARRLPLRLTALSG